MKLCECGCGQPTAISKYGDKLRSILPGAPRRFIKGHHARGLNHPKWNGGKQKHSAGCIVIYKPREFNLKGRGRTFEHISIAEKALGRELPSGVHVHHVNGNPGDNRNHNLVICQDAAYHRLLHQRQRAVEAGAPAHWMKCWRCKTYDAPENLLIYHSPIHAKCKSLYEKLLRIAI